MAYAVSAGNQLFDIRHLNSVTSGVTPKAHPSPEKGVNETLLRCCRTLPNVVECN